MTPVLTAEEIVCTKAHNLLTALSPGVAELGFAPRPSLVVGEDG